jgi:hypothetical protein
VEQQPDRLRSARQGEKKKKKKKKFFLYIKYKKKQGIVREDQSKGRTKFP